MPDAEPLGQFRAQGNLPLLLGWKKLGLEQSLGTRLVTYADDLVILCRRATLRRRYAICARSWAS
jgi:hypothetical protein